MVEVARRTSTTIPTGELSASAGVKATWTRIPALRYLGGRRGDQAVLLQAPRAGDARVLLGVRAAHLHRLHGLRAGRDSLPGPCREGTGAFSGDFGREARRLRGNGRARDQGPDRAQRARVPDQPRPGIEPRPDLGPAVREGRAVREHAVLPGRARRRPVVPADHGRVPAREPDPPRAEHVRALDRRRSGGAGDRSRALPGALHRVGSRGLGGRDHLQPACGHGRGVGRDLRDPRRRARPRVAAQLRARRTGDGVDRHQPRADVRDPEHLDRRPRGRARRRGAEHARALALRAHARDLRPAGAPRSGRRRGGRRGERAGRVLPRAGLDGLAPGRDRFDPGFLERGLGGRKTGQRDAVGRAGHVLEPELVAERDRGRLSPVLAADAHLQVVLDASAAFDRDPHQVPHPALVDRLERVPLEHAVLEVARQELALRVVPREAERGLGQVVRPEREEVGMFGDLVGAHARAGELDHRADQILDLALLGRGRDGHLSEALELLCEADERMHDLDERRAARLLLDGDGCADDRAHLHLVDLGPHQAEAAAARPEHRVRLLQRADPLAHLVVGRLVERRQELVQRRIEEPDRDREPGHRLEDPLEVGLLVREQLLERSAPLLLAARP